MQLVPELLQYVTEAICRIERKVEIIEDNQYVFVCKLDNMRRKHYGGTAVFQSPANSVLSEGITPPLTSPTAVSDITPFDDHHLESLLIGLDWSPPLKWSPPPVKPETGLPLSMQSEAGHSANVARERGPLTEFLTTRIPPQVGDSAGLMHDVSPGLLVSLVISSHSLGSRPSPFVP